MKKRANNGKALAAVISRAESYQDVIARHLSKIADIDAVYLLADDTNVVHVFSVVKDYQSEIYDRLLKKERAIEKKCKHVAFEFHVRAHQGREPSEAVPYEAQLVFKQ